MKEKVSSYEKRGIHGRKQKKYRKGCKRMSKWVKKRELSDGTGENDR